MNKAGSRSSDSNRALNQSVETNRTISHSTAKAVISNKVQFKGPEPEAEPCARSLENSNQSQKMGNPKQISSSRTSEENYNFTGTA